MKKLFLTAVLVLMSIVCTFSQDKISISISKSTNGEVIMTVTGHTTPLTVNIGGKEVTIQVGESEINLTALGISELTEVSVEDVDTAAGSSSVDAQATASPIPPISPFINPNPPLSTPF